MSTETQPSEHAMRAAEMIEYKSPWSTQVYVELRNAAAKAIDQHAIAPAVAEIKKELLEEARLNGKGSEREAKLLAQVAERDRRIKELKLEADAMREWLAIIGAGAENAQSLAKLALRENKDLYAKRGGAHEEPKKGRKT